MFRAEIWKEMSVFRIGFDLKQGGVMMIRVSVNSQEGIEYS